MNDLIIIGGGVIGLSVAYEMSQRGATVTVLEKPQPRGQASWAGGGILVPVCAETAVHPLEKLRALSSELHRAWSEKLRQKTGVDNGYRECGAVYFARSPGEIASLIGMMQEWSDDRIESSWLEQSRLRELIPVLSSPFLDSESCRSAWLPGESQIRNPDQLAALTKSCTENGVTFVNVSLLEVCGDRERISGVRIQESGGDGETTVVADRYLIAAGSWSGQIVEPLGFRLPMVPVRGQMLLFKLDRQKFAPVIYEGGTYIVPRADGHVLVGSTLEEAGFDATTTVAAVQRLREFANGVIPELSEETFQQAWAGLRPGTNDGFPYIGQLAPCENCFVATGHFRGGLHLSTGTAVVISNLMEDKPNEISLAPFDPARINRIEI